MYTYLFDASAAVHLYVDENPRVRGILEFVVEQRVLFHEALLYIPNLCIAEVFNALAKLRFEPEEGRRRLTDQEYKQSLDGFREDIFWAKTLYPYDLNRYHILAADDVIVAENLEPREERPNRMAKYDRLSTNDILVIAMACELGFLMDEKEVFLVTGDNRMKRVCRRLKTLTSADLAGMKKPRKQPEPPEGRWIVPAVFDIYRDSPRDLPKVRGQRPLNLREFEPR